MLLGKTVISLVVNLYYTGNNGSAQKFVEEMESSGIADAIRKEEGNEKYDYLLVMKDLETVLLIDQWKDHKVLDAQHASKMMKQIAQLRDKYDLHMRVERMETIDNLASDHVFIRK